MRSNYVNDADDSSTNNNNFSIHVNQTRNKSLQICRAILTDLCESARCNSPWKKIRRKGERRRAWNWQMKKRLRDISKHDETNVNVKVKRNEREERDNYSATTFNGCAILCYCNCRMIMLKKKIARRGKSCSFIKTDREQSEESVREMSSIVQSPCCRM